MAAMIQLDLTDAEEQDLREEVEKRLTEMEMEIAHTDSKDYRNMLKRRRDSLWKLLEKLPDMRAAA
jgi:hypothetical protein